MRKTQKHSEFVMEWANRTHLILCSTKNYTFGYIIKDVVVSKQKHTHTENVFDNGMLLIFFKEAVPNTTKNNHQPDKIRQKTKIPKKAVLKLCNATKLGG